MYLPEVFDQFCDYIDGKLLWRGKGVPKIWTETVFNFFDVLVAKQLVAKESRPYRVERNYMGIDYIWRYEQVDQGKVTYQHIELAVEHENERDVKEFLDKEIRHLVDLKADNKIAITYPALADEMSLISEIQQLIGASGRRMNNENYLIILGFTASKKALRFKGYFFNNAGDRQGEPKDKVIQKKIGQKP